MARAHHVAPDEVIQSLGQQLPALRSHPAPGSIGRKAVNLARRTWARYWTRRAAHATVAILQSLDDRALKDIGLDRSEIESVVYSERRGRGDACWQPTFGGTGQLRERRVGMY